MLRLWSITGATTRNRRLAGGISKTNEHFRILSIRWPRHPPKCNHQLHQTSHTLYMYLNGVELKQHIICIFIIIYIINIVVVTSLYGDIYAWTGASVTVDIPYVEHVLRFRTDHFIVYHGWSVIGGFSSRRNRSRLRSVLYTSLFMYKLFLFNSVHFFN